MMSPSMQKATDRKIAEAAARLDVPPKEMQPFDVEDPFNANRLRGYLCHRSDRRYGAIVLTHVGDYQAEQLIYAVPKFPYPFDRQGTYRFPTAERIEAYEKIDGTSIYGYVYHGGGKAFLTFKLRLHPVLRDGRFGPFLSMWQEMVDRYPMIPRAVIDYCRVDQGKQGLAFELYGSRNKHLVIYPEELDCRCVFGVDKEGNLEPPSAVEMSWASRRPDGAWRFPPPPDVKVVTQLHDLKGLYRSMQAEMDSHLEEKPELEGYVGAEGRVWYMLAPDGGWAAFKCKPETIEAIHFAAGGIGKEILRATAYNVLETEDEVTEDALRRLLLEEFNEFEIEKVAALVTRVLVQVNEEVRFKRDLFDLYDRLGLNLAADKRGTMRALSEHFPKSSMKHVYSVLEAGR